MRYWTYYAGKTSFNTSFGNTQNTHMRPCYELYFLTEVLTLIMYISDKLESATEYCLTRYSHISTSNWRHSNVNC